MLKLEHKTNLKEIAKLFLKLGIAGFGGPAVHIAMMHDEVVKKRKWMSELHFLNLLSVTNLIPGPNSTELAIHIGYDKKGWKGLIVAGSCFILPAVFITGFFAYFYKEYGHLPQVQPFIYGIQAGIIAVVLGAVFPLVHKTLKGASNLILFVILVTAVILGVNELVILLISGIFWMLFQNSNIRGITSVLPFGMTFPFEISSINQQLFWAFLKIGAILYGSGYVLFAFLDAELVKKGLLTQQQLIDAVAVGQFTPGPVFSSVSFIGYQINGLSGLVVSTIAIFLPSFLLVGMIQPVLKWVEKNILFKQFLEGLNIASIALIIGVIFNMASSTLIHWKALLIFAITLFLVFGIKKLNSAFIILGSSLLGYILHVLF